VKGIARRALRAFGLDVVRYRPPTEPPLPLDVSAEDAAVLRRIASYTMTSIDRQLAVIQAVRHIVRRGLAGSVVECGVWRGGSSMAAALTLLQEGDTSRELYLFDTFEGMPPPDDVDRTTDGTPARVHLERDTQRESWVWAVAGMEDVRTNMTSTGYPGERVHCVQGLVEETIPAQPPPGPIALLRLDTDWYESTQHELVHLFPRLCEGGILIVDDYGHWQGARKAVDEYFADSAEPPFLHRVDYTARLLIK